MFDPGYSSIFAIIIIIIIIIFTLRVNMPKRMETIKISHVTSDNYGQTDFPQT